MWQIPICLVTAEMTTTFKVTFRTDWQDYGSPLVEGTPVSDWEPIDVLMASELVAKFAGITVALAPAFDLA